MRGVAKGAAIVLYCQSSGCAYADDVGRSLVIDGYQNVSVYRDGWTGWDRRKKDQ